MPDNVPDHIYKELSETISKRKCTLFLGAGVAGVSSEKLMKHLIRRLKEYKLPRKNIWGFSGVAQYFEIMRGKYELQEEVKDFIERSAISSEIYELIARLPIETIFTTNYDDKLEQQFNEISRDYICIVTEKDLAKWDEKKTVIVKLHGSFEKGLSSLVITDDDYVKFLMNPNLLKDTFKHTLSTKTTIFIGYSLSDYDVKLSLEEVNSVFKGYKTLGYLIQKEEISSEQISYWGEKGVKILQINGTIFLKNLLKELDERSKNVNLSSPN